MDLGLDPRTLAEKLTPPRALQRLGNALVAPPRPGSTVAWLAWLWLPPEARGRGLGHTSLTAVEDWARSVGATRLRVGGPPGNYVVPGVDCADTALLAWFARAGYRTVAESVDLLVRVDAVESTQTRDAPRDTDLAAIEATFGIAWREEAERAHTRGGLLVAHDGATLAGFVAHSGNLAHQGSFGPVGVLPTHRGKGLGEALTRTAFAALRARGFTTVTVPWVETATLPFYERIAPIEARTHRLLLERTLTAADTD